MKHLFCLLVITSVLGAGCVSSVAPEQQVSTSTPKPNTTNSSTNIKSTTAQDFDLKLKCQPIIDKYKKEIEAKSSSNELMESFWYGCYSKTNNTCVAFIQRDWALNSKAPQVCRNRPFDFGYVHNSSFNGKYG